MAYIAYDALQDNVGLIGDSYLMVDTCRDVLATIENEVSLSREDFIALQRVIEIVESLDIVEDVDAALEADLEYEG